MRYQIEDISFLLNSKIFQKVELGNEERGIFSFKYNYYIYHELFVLKPDEKSPFFTNYGIAIESYNKVIENWKIKDKKGFYIYFLEIEKRIFKNRDLFLRSDFYLNSYAERNSKNIGINSFYSKQNVYIKYSVRDINDFMKNELVEKELKKEIIFNLGDFA